MCSESTHHEACKKGVKTTCLFLVSDLVDNIKALYPPKISKILIFIFYCVSLNGLNILRISELKYFLLFKLQHFERPNIDLFVWNQEGGSVNRTIRLYRGRLEQIPRGES